MKTTDRSWNDFWNAQDSPRESWSKIRMKRIIDPFLQSGKTILDAGCGSGFFSGYFCDRGLHVTSVDYSENALTITKRITFDRAKIIQADLFSDDFAGRFKNEFDLVFSDGLFEHFQRPQQGRLLSVFKNVLKDRGMILTFVPNLFSPWTIIRPFYMPGIEEKPFTIKRLIALNEESGLNIVSSGGINVLPWACSPEGIVARHFGMIVFAISTPTI